MKSRILFAIVTIAALLLVTPVEARSRAARLNALQARRARLLDMGAPASEIAAVDARIDALSSGVSPGASAGVGVRSTRTSPPFGHAWGYWAHGPGSRMSTGPAMGGPPGHMGMFHGRGRFR